MASRRPRTATTHKNISAGALGILRKEFLARHPLYVFSHFQDVYTTHLPPFGSQRSLMGNTLWEVGSTNPAPYGNPLRGRPWTSEDGPRTREWIAYVNERTLSLETVATSQGVEIRRRDYVTGGKVMRAEEDYMRVFVALNPKYVGEALESSRLAKIMFNEAQTRIATEAISKTVPGTTIVLKEGESQYALGGFWTLVDGKIHFSGN